MARPRTFEPEDALGAAMRLFWKRGFAETSYDDLTRETGVSRKGLYTVFGDKRALFLRALALYRKTQAIDFLSELDRPNAGCTDIQELFRRIAKVSKSPMGQIGCLMANTANDEMSTDPDVQTEIHKHLKRTSERFRLALMNDGLPSARANRLGHFLTGLLQGLFVLAHAQADEDMIDAHVQEGLTVLIT